MVTVLRSIILLAAVTFVFSLSNNESALGNDALAFEKVRVFDGVRVIPSTTVIVRDGIISAVADDAVAPAGATVIDGRGKTLIPGLIDAHTHTFVPEHLRAGIVFGVTTELDMFTLASFAAARRSEQSADKADGRADLFSAGTLVTPPGGHGTEYGFPIPTVGTADQAAEFVAVRIAEGSDYIRLVYDDGAEIGRPWKTIDELTLAAVIRAARDRKKLAVVHVLAREFARRAIAHGADGLVHLFIDKPVDDAFVRLAVERKVFVIPTLTVGVTSTVWTAPARWGFSLAAGLIPARSSFRSMRSDSSPPRRNEQENNDRQSAQSPARCLESHLEESACVTTRFAAGRIRRSSLRRTDAGS